MREVAIKGIRQGLLLVLPEEAEWDAVCGQLDAKLTAAQGLIAGSKAQLALGDRPVTPEQLGKLAEHLRIRFALECASLAGTHPSAHAAAQALGLEVTGASSAPPPLPPEPHQAPPAPPKPEGPVTPPNNALYMRQTIRSGQSVRHDGTIVICGDVNPGAEVIATGDIIVFGTLRGVAHAGAAGSEGSQIMAINLRPTQIRIAGYIARSPDTAAPPLSKYPEVARVSDSEIHIIPLREMT
jgi:septum site-determining protein MinC